MKQEVRASAQNRRRNQVRVDLPIQRHVRQADGSALPQRPIVKRSEPQQPAEEEKEPCDLTDKPDGQLFADAVMSDLDETQSAKFKTPLASTTQRDLSRTLL